jgi:hypothetical protein
MPEITGENHPFYTVVQHFFGDSHAEKFEKFSCTSERQLLEYRQTLKKNSVVLFDNIFLYTTPFFKISCYKISRKKPFNLSKVLCVVPSIVTVPLFSQKLEVGFPIKRVHVDEKLIVNLRTV